MEQKNENLKTLAFHEQRLLGFDIGSRRIGLAIWNPQTRLAEPLPTLNRSTLAKDLLTIEKTIEKNSIETLVVGLPIALSGSHTESTKNAEFWKETLQKRFEKIPVQTVDESLSTQRALERISHLKPEKRAEIKDSISAVIILEDFLRESKPDSIK